VIRLVVILGALTLTPSIGCCDDAPPSPCVNALEQIATLQTWVPIYKQLPGDARHYLKDSDRPAELTRIRAVAASACGKDAAAQAAQQAAADRLHTARSPECAIERDKLRAMEDPDSLEADDSIADQRELVAQQCPAVQLTDVWLLDMVWVSPMKKLTPAQKPR
jgi:hypothetical protein